MKGYIKLHRSSMDSHLYFAETFTKWQAWTDLLLLANHAPRTVSVRGIMVHLSRGEVLAGERFLADRWRWSRGKVRRFLSYLSSETVHQIVPQKSNVCGIISICNYETYQGNGFADETANGTTDKPTDGPQTDTLKNDKNEKEREREAGSGALFATEPQTKTQRVKVKKKAYGEFSNVRLSEDEHDRLSRVHGEGRLERGIDILDTYIEQSGKRYKSHYAVLKAGSWVWDRVTEGKGTSAPSREVQGYFEEAVRIITQQKGEGIGRLWRKVRDTIGQDELTRLKGLVKDWRGQR